MTHARDTALLLALGVVVARLTGPMSGEGLAVTAAVGAALAASIPRQRI